MKLLLIHSDYIEFEPKEKTKMAEDYEGGKQRIEECLVVFTSVERGDEVVVDKVVEEIRDVTNKVKVNRVVLYPYAHLSSDLADPDTAIKVLKQLEEKLNREFEVYRAPFGWYKAFKISCKGHPLSELSREIRAKEEADVTEALKAEEKVESYWFILTPDKKLVEVNEFDFTGYENLRKFASYEIAKRRAVDRTPPHVELMRGLK